MKDVTPLEPARTIKEQLTQKAASALMSANAAFMCLGILIGVFLMVTVVYFKTIDDITEDHEKYVERILANHAEVIRDYKEETELSQIYYTKAEAALELCARRLENVE